MVVDKLGHHGDGDSAWTLREDFCNLLILQTNHILAVHLSQIVVDQYTIPISMENSIVSSLQHKT